MRSPGGIGLDQAETGEAARHARDQIGGDTFRRGEREDLVGIGVVAERAGEGDRQPAAREIDRGVESVAGAGLPEASVRSARHLDHDFADGKDEIALLAHDLDRKGLREGPGCGTMTREAPIWQRNGVRFVVLAPISTENQAINGSGRHL